jgi:hypothetical protein
MVETTSDHTLTEEPVEVQIGNEAANSQPIPDQGTSAEMSGQVHECERDTDSGTVTDNDTDSDEEYGDITLKEDTELYTILVDDVPAFYTRNAEKARTYMWTLARARRTLDPMCSSYIREHDNPDAIQVVTSNRLYGIAYERVVCSLSVHSIMEAVERDNVPKQVPETQPIPAQQPSGLLSRIFG